MEPDYEKEFYGLLGFIGVYTFVAILLSMHLGLLLGNITFFTVIGLPFYLMTRLVLLHLQHNK